VALLTGVFEPNLTKVPRIRFGGLLENGIKIRPCDSTGSSNSEYIIDIINWLKRSNIVDSLEVQLFPLITVRFDRTWGKFSSGDRSELAERGSRGALESQEIHNGLWGESLKARSASR
jgi:hypothetical protein